jgi:hypothetical protein
MTTASDVVTAALGLTLTRAGDIPLEPNEIAQGIFQLNNMMASWSLSLGYTKVSSSSDPITTPDYAIDAMVQNLAIRLAPSFGGMVDADLRENARQAKKDMLRQAVKIGPAKMPRTLPRGTGNTRPFRDSRYYEPVVEAAPTDGLLTLESNATETTITTASVPVLVSGAWEVISTHQMDGTAAGRLTYLPTDTALMEITAKATIKMASSGSKVVTAFLAKNGVVIAANGSGSATDSLSTTIEIPWKVEMSQNDYLELWVSNTSDTVNLIVSDAELRIS